jgi:hypothetical protein
MNATTVRIATYAGACVAGLATSCVLAAPALAMAPPVPAPEPGSGQHHKIFDSLDGRSGPAATQASADIGSASGGVDWSTLAYVLGGGMALTGFVVLGATQVRRHQEHPA